MLRETSDGPRALPSEKLGLVAAVVDEDDVTGHKSGGKARDPAFRGRAGFPATADRYRLRDPPPQVGRARRTEHLDKLATLLSHEDLAYPIRRSREHVNWKRVEHFVGEDDPVNWRETARNRRPPEIAAFEGERLFRAHARAHLHDRGSRAARGIGSLAFQCREEIPHEDAPARARFDEVPGRWLPQTEPEIRDSAGERPPERRSEVRRRHVVALETKRGPCRVVAAIRIEESALHVIGERQRPARGNARDQAVGEISHRVSLTVRFCALPA